MTRETEDLAHEDFQAVDNYRYQLDMVISATEYLVKTAQRMLNEGPTMEADWQLVEKYTKASKAADELLTLVGIDHPKPETMSFYKTRGTKCTK